MDKKNTILLTVIAVATLLVAVVGATFAYFSITTSGDQAQTQVNVTTPEAGVITLTPTNPTLYLKPTVAQFSQANASNNYYAVTTDAAPETTAQNIEFAKLSVTGGDSSTSYTCTSKLTVSVSGTMAESLQAGDAFISLKADKSTGLTGESDKFNAAVDLKTINDDSDSTYQDIEVTWTVGNDAEATLNGDVYLVNKAKAQDALVNKELSVTVTLNSLSCSVAS